MKITLIALALASSAIIFIYAFIGMERVWEFTSGNADMGPVNFKTLKKTPKPNQYFLCPKDYCLETPDAISNTYDIAAKNLFTEILAIAEDDTGIELLALDETELTLRFLSRTPVLKFPDTTNIKVVEISENQSTLAIYAQAKIGSFDFGANKLRVDTLVKKLDERITSSR